MTTAEELERLVELRDRGVLSEDEYLRLKLRLLEPGGGHGSRRGRSLAVIGIAAAVVVVLAGVVLALRGDNSDASQAVTTAPPTVSAAPTLTTTTVAASTTAPTTTLVVVVSEAEAVSEALRLYGELETPRLMGMMYARAQSEGELWAPNGSPSSVIAACVIDTVAYRADFVAALSRGFERLAAEDKVSVAIAGSRLFRASSAVFAGVSDELRAYAVGVCAGYSEADARAMAGW